MDSTLQEHSPKMQTLELWPGTFAEFDPDELRSAAIRVKGVAYHSPLRFLEIFGNEVDRRLSSMSPELPRETSWNIIEHTFFPNIPGLHVTVGDDVPQPPYAWRDASPWQVCVSFTYNTNAFYRILSLLRDTGRIRSGDVDTLLDQACLILSRLYQLREGFLLRNINNNFNMYLVSKVIEHLVGKNRYDADLQELDTTRRSLQAALTLAPDHASLPAYEKMAIAVGAGVAFIESRLSETGQTLTQLHIQEVQDLVYGSYNRQLAIDHRSKLFDLIEDGCRRKGKFLLAVILDDATETVDDLLWIQDLIAQFPGLVIHLLVNAAQVSINFSIHMLSQILTEGCFGGLAAKLGEQFLITEMYCPFISFQTNYLPATARQVVDAADAVFVKGANFFETCQIPNKNTFHGFVVYGGVSRTYTGLHDFDRVFAWVPMGQEGYRHARDKAAIVTLGDLCFTRPLGSESAIDGSLV